MTRNLVCNPPWVTRIIGDAYEAMREIVQSSWLPLLENVQSRGEAIRAEVREYGCGHYGCVFPTGDPNVVLKVTTDETEAEFAAKYANGLEPMICVMYHQALKLPVKHEGRDVYLLWRESAEYVGQIDTYIDAERGSQAGDHAAFLMDAQHQAGQQAYAAVYRNESDAQKRVSLQAWAAACRRMASDPMVPELRPLGLGLVDNYHEQRILFGDVHLGNVGRVQRGDAYHWVITDPGHIAVVYFH